MRVALNILMVVVVVAGCAGYLTWQQHDLEAKRQERRFVEATVGRMRVIHDYLSQPEFLVSETPVSKSYQHGRFRYTFDLDGQLVTKERLAKGE